MLLAGRVLCGIGDAATFTCVSMYLAEISPAAERGFHLAAQELACVLGCAASAAAGPPLRC